MQVFWTLITSVVAIVPITFLWKSWTDRLARLRAESIGSNLTVKDGVQDLGEDPVIRVRWCALTARGWEPVPIRIKCISVIWPLAKLISPEHLAIDPTRDFLRSIDFDVVVAPAAEFKTTQLISVGPLLRRWPIHTRLRVKIIAETIDAQRRKTTLKLRSNPVDWGALPQK
ncbi:hypothetical protein ABID58_007524 [Bradyrhizobium sp. S3.2.6]|uniref:hypothetical protein n=1 Tax=Bradyrhizobium sp. S3.2.6 TaxID=3156428 RepID=UPI003398894D